MKLSIISFFSTKAFLVIMNNKRHKKLEPINNGLRNRFIHGVSKNNRPIVFNHRAGLNFRD